MTAYRLYNRLHKLEIVHDLREHAGTTPRQVRILLTEKEWASVPVGSLIHVGGEPPRVYRYCGGYDPEKSSFLGEELEGAYWQTWGLQPVDYVVLDI